MTKHSSNRLFYVSVSVLALLCASSKYVSAATEKPETPFVHVHKEFDVFEGVVGREMTFEVEIHNMGGETAFNVEFFDDSLANEDGKSLKIKSGGTKNSFDKIDAGDYVSFKQVIIPLVSGPLLMPSSIVTYSETKGGKKISVVGSVDGFQVLTAAESHVQSALKIGKFVSLGFCKTLNDWIRFAAVFSVFVGILVSKRTFSTVKKAKDARQRKLAQRALGVEDIMKEN